MIDCINSIKSQSVGVQHILIDGASTDESRDVIQSNRGHFASIVSEPDDGMYDAMNKGLTLATGEVIGILNADDVYSDGHVIEKVLTTFEDSSVVGCYGDLVYLSKSGNDRIIRNWKSGKFNKKKFYWGWMPPHPTFFVRKSAYTQFGNFRTELGSAADYELMLRFMLKHNIKVTYIPEILVNMSAGGVSNSSFANRVRANRLDKKAWRLNNLHPYFWTFLAKPIRKIGQWL